MGCISYSATVGVETPAMEALTNSSVSESSIKDKAKQVENFVDSCFNISTSDFSTQPVLLELIMKVKFDLKVEYEANMKNHSDIYMWSSAKFQLFLTDILLDVERVVLMKHLPTLQDLVDLCKSLHSSPQKLDIEQKEIVKIIICGSVVQRKFKMTDTLKEKYFHSLSSKIVKTVMADLDQYSEATDEKQAMRQLMIDSQKHNLRMINMKNHTVTTVVKQYNLIVKNPSKVKPESLPNMEIFEYLVKKKIIDQDGVISSSFKFSEPKLWEDKEGFKFKKFNDEVIHVLKTVGYKDAIDKTELEQLASGILDIYREKEDASYIGVEELKEITALAGMKNPEIYKRILSQMIADIDNDTLLDAFKLKLLGAILLPVAGSPENFNGQYCSGDDLNACLRLIVRKLDTILISSDNSNLDDMYDALNIVLTLMAEMKLSGLKSADVELLQEKMSSFNDSAIHSMRKLTGFVIEYGANVPLKAKNNYANEALKRIGGTRKEEMAEADQQTINAVMGSCNLIVGAFKMDPDMILEGLMKLGELALEIYLDQDYEWYDLVSIIQTQSYQDFSKFKENFLNKDKNEMNSKLNTYSTSDRQNLTFFLTEVLYRIASDLTKSKEQRIYCLDTLFKIQNSKKSFNWIVMNDDLRYHIINLILRIQILSQKNPEKMQMVDRALGYIKDIKIFMKKSLQEWLENLEEKFIKNETVQFSNSGENENLGNVMLLEALQQKMVINYFLATLSEKGEEEYRKYVKPLTMIDIEGYQYIEAKIQNVDCKNHKKSQELLCIDKIAKTRIQQLKEKNLRTPNAKQEEAKTVNHVLINEAIETFLASQSRVLLIQGDAGTGKSIYLKLVEHRIYKQYLLGQSDYIPIFVRLSEIKDPSKCIQELLQSLQSSRQAYTKMKESDKKFLFLLDGYDELKVPKNMFITNKLNEWKGTAKLLITSRQEYLVAYGNYQRYFKPNFKDVRQNILLEYRISEVSKEQRTVYIEKTVLNTLNTINQLDKVADQDEINSMKQWSKFEKYDDAITQTPGLEDLIKTPYMLTIIMNILPDLEMQKTSKDEQITKSTIYKTFTKQYQQRQANKIMDGNAAEIPKGLDLETSFYNFSISLAIRMFKMDKTTVIATENKFPYPRKTEKENVFSEYFNNDTVTKLSRSGAQIIIVDGQARFTHKSIMEYFAARVFYEEIKFFEAQKDLPLSLDNGWIQDKLLKGDKVTDQESDVLNFVVDMITYNYIKQNEMSKHDLDDAEASKSNSLTKLVKLAEAVNKSAYTNDGKIDISLIREVWQQNVITLACSFPQALSMISKELQEAIFKDSVSSNNLKENICIGIAKGHAKQDDQEHAVKYYKMAMAFRMGAIDYEGEYTGNFMHSIKAHGQGKISYENGMQYVGQFIDGKIQETGQIEITFPDQSIYKGAWEQKKIQGQGIMTYPNGIQIQSQFKQGRAFGKSKVSNPIMQSETSEVVIDIEQMDKWETELNLKEKTVGQVEKDKFIKTQYNFTSGFVKFQSEKLRINPMVNRFYHDLVISFDFMTQDSDCSLFCMNYCQDEKSYSDKHIFLKNGTLVTQFFPRTEELVCDIEKMNLAQGEWHHIDVIQDLGNKIIFKVDGVIVGEQKYLKYESTTSTSYNDQICLGYSSLKNRSMKAFTGSIKNLSMKEYVPTSQFKSILFKEFEAEESNGSSLINFALKKSKSTRVEEIDGELVFKDGFAQYSEVDKLTSKNFQIEMDFKHDNQGLLPIFSMENLLDTTLGNFEFYQYYDNFNIQVSPESEVVVEQSKAGDGKWHHIRIIGDIKQLTVQLDDNKIQRWESTNGYFFKPSIITLGKGKFSAETGYTGKLKNIYMGKMGLLGLVKKTVIEKKYTMDQQQIQGCRGTMNFQILDTNFTCVGQYLCSTLFFLDPIEIFNKMVELYKVDKQNKCLPILMSYIKFYSNSDQIQVLALETKKILGIGEPYQPEDKTLYGLDNPDQYKINIRNMVSTQMTLEGDTWNFESGYSELSWEASENLQYPENVLPQEDFQIYIEFKTKKEQQGLFSLRDTSYTHQRQISLDSTGRIQLEFHDGGAKSISDTKYNDDQWHSIKVVCSREKSLQIFVDNVQIKDDGLTKRTECPTISCIYFGYAHGILFAGLMKNASFKTKVNQRFRIIDELFQLENK